MKQNTLINEIDSIRKQMGLPPNSNYGTILKEILTPNLILEQFEVGVVNKVLKGIFPSLTDNAIDDILRSNPAELPYQNRTLRVSSSKELMDYTVALNKSLGNTETAEALLTRMLRSETSPQMTTFKTNIKTSLNRMNMRGSLFHIDAERASIDALTDGTKNITANVESITLGGHAFTVEAISIPVGVSEDVITTLERRLPNNDVEAWVDSNISNKTEHELDVDIEAIIEGKKLFSTECDSIVNKIDEDFSRPGTTMIANDEGYILMGDVRYTVKDNVWSKSVKNGEKWGTPTKLTDADEIANLTSNNQKSIVNVPFMTTTQRATLKTSINTIKVAGEKIFDNAQSFYTTAKENQVAVAASERLTSQLERTIYDLETKEIILTRLPNETEDYRLTSDGDGKWWRGNAERGEWVEITDVNEINRITSAHIDELNNNSVICDNELIETMVRNISGENIEERRGFIGFIRRYQSFKWGILKRPLDDMIRMYTNWKRMAVKSGKLLDPLKEFYSEASGRYSYDEVRLRLQKQLNEMLKIVNEGVETGIKNTDPKTSASKTARLTGMLKEMQDVASMRKFAGNFEDVRAGKPGSVIDQSRIIDTPFGPQFIGLEDIAKDFVVQIERAVSENVKGADELLKFWNTSVAGETNINKMINLLESLDTADKSSKRPSITLNLEFWKDIMPWLRAYSKRWEESSAAKAAKDAKSAKESEKVNESLDRGEWKKKGWFKTNVTPIPKVIKSFFLSTLDMTSEVVIKGMYNQFKYNHFMSIDEINRLSLKYGSIKGRIIIIIREMVVHVIADTLVASLYALERAIELIVGHFDSDGDYSLPLHKEILAYMLKNATGKNGEITDEDWKVQSELFSTWYSGSFLDVFSSFFNNPVHIKSLLPLGMASNFANGVSYALYNMGADVGFDDDPDFFTLESKLGWYQSQIDESLIMGIEMVKTFYQSFDKTNAEDELEKAKTFLTNVEKRLDTWKKTGSEYAEDKIDEIQAKEKNTKDAIDKTVNSPGYDNFPKPLADNKELFLKFKDIITLERAKDSDFKQKSNDKDKESLKIKWNEWYDLHKDNVGIIDLKGEFWRIDTGFAFYNVIDWAGKYHSGMIINGNDKVPYQADYYIRRPYDNKLYNLSLVSRFFSDNDIIKLHENLVGHTEMEIDESNYQIKKSLYENDRAPIIKKIYTLKSYIKESCETKPILCHKWNTRLSGGTVMEGNVSKTYDPGYLKELARLDSDFKKVKEAYEKQKKSKPKTPAVPPVKTENKSLSYSNIINEYLSLNNIHQPKMRNLKSKLIESKRFDQDDYKHWKDTFTFQAVDEKNPGKYKDVKLNMDDVMDRIPHYRKKYDEDDSFVRAVVDTHENVVRLMFTKDLANIREGYTPTGFAMILQQIREGRGEMEIWSVARPASGNWFLVKGDFTPKELTGMDLEKNEPADKEPKKRENSLETLKKKELTSAQGLKNDERSGFNELPKILKQKLKEKFNNGWTTEDPPKKLQPYYTNSEISSVFGDNIKIYKLNASEDFFNLMSSSSEGLPIKRGFCRSIQLSKNNENLTDEHMVTIKHILNVCKNKFNGMLGISNIQ